LQFPDGFASVVDYIHSLGLQAGIYTARGSNTCAGFAGSCGHEAQDAAQFAEWGISYIKVKLSGARPFPLRPSFIPDCPSTAVSVPQDDDCSGCSTYLNDYHAMQAGIWASSDPSIFLSIEGGAPPNYTDYSNGGHGQCVAGEDAS
jgi:hypothetical protein